MNFVTYQNHRFKELMGFGGVSARLFTGMHASIEMLSDQLAEIQETNSTQLAIHQLVLHRDELQQLLEELIYQGQKMVEAFSKNDDSTPSVQKALLIRSFQLCLAGSGIGTGMIRGLENKRAFDSLISHLEVLYKQLSSDPDVLKAIAAEKAAEQDRLSLEVQQQAEERQRRLEERQRRLEEEQRRLEEVRRNAPVPVRISRIATATGYLYEVAVSINGQKAGAVFGDQSLILQLQPGAYVIKVAGGGLSNSLTLTVERNQPLEFEMYFSNWGILGGGLVLRPKQAK